MEAELEFCTGARIDLGKDKQDVTIHKALGQEGTYWVPRQALAWGRTSGHSRCGHFVMGLWQDSDWNRARAWDKEAVPWAFNGLFFPVTGLDMAGIEHGLGKDKTWVANSSTSFCHSSWEVPTECWAENGAMAAAMLTSTEHFWNHPNALCCWLLQETLCGKLLCCPHLLGCVWVKTRRSNKTELRRQDLDLRTIMHNKLWMIQ